MRGVRPATDPKTTIPVVIPLSWVERLNLAAEAHSVTRSALIRTAIDAILFDGNLESATTPSARDQGAAEERDA